MAGLLSRPKSLKYAIALWLSAFTPIAVHAQPSTEETAIRAEVDAFLDAIHARDAVAVIRMVASPGNVTALTIYDDGFVDRVSQNWVQWSGILLRSEEVLEETLIDPEIRVDGEAALVWSRYEFRIDGELSHCGIDHFDLIRRNGEWHILNLTYTREYEGCEDQ